MYVRIYEQIFGSSIMEENLGIRYVWFCLLALADKEGFIDMTIPAIARRINTEESLVKDSIKLFCSPDPKSRNASEEGRRLVPMRESFGWQVVNYLHYRDLKDQTARTEYMREYMRARRASESEKQNEDSGLDEVVSTCKLPLTPLVPTTTASYSTTTTNNPPTPRRGKVADLNGFGVFWITYPKKISKGQAERAWAKLRPDEQLQGRILAGLGRAKTSEQWAKDEGRYIPHAATWLNARGWEDEVMTAEDGAEAFLRRHGRKNAS